MKVLPFKIPKPQNEAVVYQVDKEKVFYDQLHQHAEIQISYIKEGSGMLLVGDTLSHFKKGDVFVIGSYLPHAFKSDTSTNELSEMHTLFFDKNAFGETFFSLPDLTPAKTFFDKTFYGMQVVNQTTSIKEYITNLGSQNTVERLATLLLVISLIAQSDTKPLSSFVYPKNYSENEGQRMNRVFDYAMSNYHNPIMLDTIANLANMSKNAFCRYFKKRTNKTFIQFLIEIRIDKACKILANNPEQPVSFIAEQCGFTNVANFNRKFKLLKGCTPTQFRTSFKSSY